MEQDDLKDRIGRLERHVQELLHERRKTAREAERQYRTLLEHTDVGVWLASADGPTLYVNAAMCRLLEVDDIGELAGASFLDFFSPRELETIRSHLALRAAGQASTYEVELTGRRGTRRNVILSGTPVMDDQGRLRSLLGTFTDITGRKKAERSLQEAMARLGESERRFRTLVEQMPAVTYSAALDPESTTLYVSPQIEAMLGFSSQDYAADPGLWRKRLHPDDLDRVMREVADAQGGLRPLACEYRLIARDGRTVWVRDEAAIISDRQGRPAVLQGVMFDISPRKAAERQIEQYQSQLRTLASELLLAEERERRELAADLHDGLGQTLTLAAIRLAELGRTADPASADALSQVRDLIDQANRAARSLTFQISPPVLHDLGLAAALEWLGEDLQARHGLEVVLEEEGRRFPMDDSTRVIIYRSVRELLTNVIKHAGAGEARVALAREGNTLRITVEDDGRGFDPAAMFEDRSQPDRRRGRFGLFSIRERLNQLGGSVQIDTSPGRGTTVTLRAPLSVETGSPS
ncbi:MAG: hypothetical protein BIFFINMI_01988 [Phycisphaerae bacterium]|nr:hypothetical protein [Phycisphaerae bacterium]